MSVALPVSNPASALAEEVDRAGGEITMPVFTLLELFEAEEANTNVRRRVSQSLGEHDLACDPHLIRADTGGFTTVYASPRGRGDLRRGRSQQPLVEEDTQPLLPRRPGPAPKTRAEEAEPAAKSGVTMTARGVLVGLLLVLFVAGGGFLAYTLGQGSRLSEAEVTSKVNEAVALRGERAEDDQAAAVAAQRSRDVRVRKAAVKKAKKVSYDKGYAAGNSAGYSAGNSAGYSAGSADGYQEGNADGVEEGIETASDELTCSDDMDVALPPCWDY